MIHHKSKHQPSAILMKLFLAVLLFISPCLAAPQNHPRPHLPLPNRIITQFPNPTWLENIAIRSNGDLLLTESAPTANLHLVSLSGSTARRETIHTFSEVEAMFGVTEPVEDLFVVVGGNVSSNGDDHGSGEGSWFFSWSVDFRHTTNTSTQNSETKKPRIKKLTRLSKAVLPNGLASIPDNSNVVLIADSFAGLVGRSDIRIGSYDVAVHVPEMAAPVNSSNLVGVNGIKVHQGYLYWTNSATVSIYRVKVDRNGYHHHYHNKTAAGVELVADLTSEATFLDDFAIDDKGVIWVVTNSGNKLFAVDTSETKGKKVVLVNGAETELTFAGDTAAAFGRGRENKMLYVTTCGGLRTPVNGTVTEGGKVVGVDTGGFGFSWL